MLKAAAVLAVPGALGGIGWMYSGQDRPNGQEAQFGAYLIEVGAAFPEAAIRAALPDGLEPAPGFTGGIAIFGDPESPAASLLSGGHLWVDVVDQTDRSLTRYIVRDLTSELYQDDTTIALSPVANSDVLQLGTDGVLHILAWPDRVSELELVVKVSAQDCTGQTVSERSPLASYQDGTLGAVSVAVSRNWCRTEAEVAWANVTAPPGHALRPFVPQQVLWAAFTTPG